MRFLAILGLVFVCLVGTAQARTHHRHPARPHARVHHHHHHHHAVKVAAAAGADPVLLGDTTLETFGDSNGAGQAQAWPYTATITGTATDIEVYVNTGNAATRIGVGLYSNASGHPSSRLTYASITTIHAGAWNDITVPSVNVTAGTQYWLAILGTGGTAAFRDKAAGTCATSGSQTNQTSMPATWSQAWQVTGYCPGSIYLNGTTPAPIAPANTTLPAISGTAQQGQTLTATQGSWSGTTPITYAYQWQDCAAGTCQNITGATSSTYTPVANDVGSTLDVVVTATNTAGSAHATSAVTQTVSAPNPDPGGQAMPTGDTAGWHQVFADNFAGDNVPVGSFSGCAENGSVITSHCSGLPTAVDQNWWAYPDGWSGTPSTGTYYPSKSLSIQNGIMDYFIHSETIGGVDTHIIDAPIPKDPAATGSWGGQVYGKYVVRAKLDSLPGYHASFLLWPDSNNWPNDGEIDWPEADFDQSITGAFMHWQNATAGSQQDAYTSNTAMSSGWHTYETDWTASAVSFYVDGTLVGKSTDPTKIPNTPMHWVLQVGNSFTEPTPADSTSGHVQVDWATIYQSTASAPANTTAPSISGTPTQGQTLTVSNGSWNGSPTGYAYQWQGCDSTGANCSNIAGATSGSYTLAASDVGHTVDVIVTATNAAGSTQATSKTVGPVVATPPPPPPSGTLVGDQTVEGNHDSNATNAQAWQYTATASGTAGSISGYVDGTGPVSLGLYADNGGQPGTLLDSATISTPASGAWNKASLNGGVQVQTGTSYWLAWVSSGSDGFRDNAAGSCKYALSSATSLAASFNTDRGSGSGFCPASIHVDTPDTASAPQNTSPPTISGTTSQGAVLTADPGRWTGFPSPTFAYQWQDCSSTCTNITGATSKTFTLQGSDVGQTVDVVVTASNSQGSANATSTKTATITAAGANFNIQGTKIIAPDNSTFLPVGANLDGQDIWWNVPTAGTSASAKAWGWNTVRLNTCMPGGCPAAYDGCGATCDYLPSPALDNEITDYTGQHIVTMIAQMQYTNSNFTPSDPNYQALVNWWVNLAQKYKGNPYVWFNVLNEAAPTEVGNASLQYQEYMNLYEPIVKAIRATGAQNMIVLDGAWDGQDSADFSCSNNTYQTYSDNINIAPTMEARYGNILPSVHVYNMWGGGGNDHPAGSCTQQSLEAAFVGYMQAVHNAGVPLIVGETGDNNQCNGVDVGQVPGQCQGMLVAEDCAAKYGVGLLLWHGDMEMPPVVSGNFTDINSQTNPTNLSTANVTSPAPWDQGWGGGKALWDLGHGTYSSSRCTS